MSEPGTWVASRQQAQANRRRRRGLAVCWTCASMATGSVQESQVASSTHHLLIGHGTVAVATDDTGDNGRRNAVFTSKVSNFLARICLASDFPNGIIGEFPRLAAALRTGEVISPLGNGIPGIIATGSSKQMRQVQASRIVAVMAHLNTHGQVRDAKPIDQPVNQLLFLVDAYSPVAVLNLVALPLPASGFGNRDRTRNLPQQVSRLQIVALRAGLKKGTCRGSLFGHAWLLAARGVEPVSG